ncbi:hypothetical protein EJ04DRAFT_272762 [Polyplosphaeria fusca]|uniref:Uncharacterized protein n=1 Tax=Polyplosphaeria fusca TaxID=682080 RepID=A0A9P4V2M1_9PLEO|nr:hypothetical protein EJ04DRAFT_272762 [Polyplosphaeria fusca]
MHHRGTRCGCARVLARRLKRFSIGQWESTERSYKVVVSCLGAAPTGAVSCESSSVQLSRSLEIAEGVGITAIPVSVHCMQVLFRFQTPFLCL